MAKHRPGYSHRPQQLGQVAAPEEGQHECARQPPEWCSGSRIVQQPDGTMRRSPGLTYQAFCRECRNDIVTCLEELPSAYERLAAEIGNPSRSGFTGHVPFGPSEPLRKDVDALMRHTAGILGGWAARVRAVAQLAQPTPGRDPGSLQAVTAAADTLADRVDVLLALQPGWMTRTEPLPVGKPGNHHAQAAGTCRHCGRVITRSPFSGWWWAADNNSDAAPWCDHQPQENAVEAPPPAPIPASLEDLLADEEIVRLGVDFVTVTTRRDGADAGNDIIELRYRARRILGETKALPETFDGIPCRACEDMSLERAEPPSDPKTPVMKSRCASCGDMMDAAEFEAWADRYAKWAESAAIPACRHCQREEHDQCAWPACPCRACGHAAA